MVGKKAGPNAVDYEMVTVRQHSPANLPVSLPRRWTRVLWNVQKAWDWTADNAFAAKVGDVASDVVIRLTVDSIASYKYRPSPHIMSYGRPFSFYLPRADKTHCNRYAASWRLRALPMFPANAQVHSAIHPTSYTPPPTPFSGSIHADSHIPLNDTMKYPVL